MKHQVAKRHRSDIYLHDVEYCSVDDTSDQTTFDGCNLQHDYFDDIGYSVDCDELTNKLENIHIDEEVLTFHDRLLLMISFIIKQNISYSAIGDLIKIMGLTNEHEIKSVYVFRKWLKEFSVSPEVHYLCPEDKCSFSSKASDLPEHCTACNTSLDKKSLSRSGHYFLYMPLKSLLRQFLEVKENEDHVYEFLKADAAKVKDGMMRDMTDSKRYKDIAKEMKSIRVDNLCQPTEYNYLTFQFNLDGVETAKSAANSLYPLYVNLVELEPALRKDAILIPFLFLKNKERHIRFKDSYLSVFIKDCCELYQSGAKWHSTLFDVECNTRFVPYCLNCDSVMKPDLNGVVGHGGYHSCPVCIIRGCGIKTSAGGTKISRIPQLDSDGRIIPQPERTEETVLGCNFTPALKKLSGFNIFKDCSIDSMHGLHLGVFKHLYSMLFNDSSSLVYVGSKGRKIASDVMSKINGVSFISRGPRNLSESALWKATEWKHFGYLYSIAIIEALVGAGLASLELLENWVNLMAGLSLLNSVCISPIDLINSRCLLEKFLFGFMTVYGVDRFTINVHLISHLPDKVEHLGPLWCYSLYQYESFNKVVLNTFRIGSKGILQQIAERSQMSSCLAQLHSDLVASLSNKKAEEISKKALLLRKTSSHFVTGKPKSSGTISNLAIFQRSSLSDVKLYIHNVITSENSVVETFDRLTYKGVPYTSSHYKEHLKKKKVDCHFYSTKLDVFGRIDVIIKIEGKYFAVYKALKLATCHHSNLPDNFSLLPYIKLYQSTRSKFSIISFYDISRKCISIDLSDDSSIIAFEMNSFEGH